MQHAKVGDDVSRWRRATIAAGATHHEIDGIPLYDARFDEVLKFHEPGLAPARTSGAAFHIGEHGQAVYAARWIRAFGFYEGLAAVQSEDGWLHIDANGDPSSRRRWAWCGNFQEGRCPVRALDCRYAHIGRDGEPIAAITWRYAGDYRDGVAVVQGDDGRSTHVDRNGSAVHGRWFADLDVFHKGFARARDDLGWMHVDREGRTAYARRFASVEPFYNGQARVERFDGGIEVINETGGTMVETRGPCPMPHSPRTPDRLRRAIALFGPPGVGKSTLVALARSRGVAAVDAETLGATHDERAGALGELLGSANAEPLLIGAADLPPEAFPAGTRFVLLLPPEEELERRVAARGDRREHKAVDHARRVRAEHAAMRGRFDVVIETAGSPEETLGRVLA